MTDPIQEQLIAARKNQILDAATATFAEKGFHQTTIRDIARQAGIADGTIYNYFSSKPELLLGIFERLREQVMSENPPPGPETQDLSGFVRELVRHPLMSLKADHFALFRIIISEMMVSEELRILYYQEIMHPTLEAAEGHFRQLSAAQGVKEESAGLVVRAISGMILGLILEYIMGDEALVEQWEELPDVLAELLIYGLKGQGGQHD